jgi:hypothetical protein
MTTSADSTTHYSRDGSVRPATTVRRIMNPTATRTLRDPDHCRWCGEEIRVNTDDEFRSLTHIFTGNRRCGSGAVQTDTSTDVDEAAIARPVQAGDIFSASWGYDQTNVDFYLVQSVTSSGKSVRLVKIGQTRIEGDRVVPNPDRILGTPEVHRIGKGYHGQPSIKVRPWGVWAWPWDGTSHYQTDPSFGH